MAASFEPANSFDAINYSKSSPVQPEYRELLPLESGQHSSESVAIDLYYKLIRSAKNKRRYGLVTNHHIIESIDSDYLQYVKVIFKELVSCLDEVFYLNNENIGELRESYSDIDA
ncbi:hypothetical protein M569_17625, partial [Genlisea aurea]